MSPWSVFLITELSSHGLPAENTVIKKKEKVSVVFYGTKEAVFFFSLLSSFKFKVHILLIV